MTESSFDKWREAIVNSLTNFSRTEALIRYRDESQTQDDECEEGKEIQAIPSYLASLVGKRKRFSKFSKFFNYLLRKSKAQDSKSGNAESEVTQNSAVDLSIIILEAQKLLEPL